MLNSLIEERTDQSIYSMRSHVDEWIREKIASDNAKEKVNHNWLIEKMTPAIAKERGQRLHPSDMALHIHTADKDIAVIPVWKDFNNHSSTATRITGTDFNGTSFAPGYQNDLYFFFPTQHGIQTGVLNISKVGVIMGDPLVATIQAKTLEGHPMLLDDQNPITIPMNQEFGSSYQEPKDVLQKHMQKYLSRPKPLEDLMSGRLKGADISLPQLPAYFALNTSRSQRDDRLDPLKLCIRLFPSTYDCLSTMRHTLESFWGDNGING